MLVMSLLCSSYSLEKNGKKKYFIYSFIFNFPGKVRRNKLKPWPSWKPRWKCSLQYRMKYHTWLHDNKGRASPRKQAFLCIFTSIAKCIKYIGQFLVILKKKIYSSIFSSNTCKNNMGLRVLLLVIWYAFYLTKLSRYCMDFRWDGRQGCVPN